MTKRVGVGAALRLVISGVLSVFAVQACGDDGVATYVTPDGGTSGAAGTGGGGGAGGSSSGGGGAGGDAGTSPSCKEGAVACLGDRLARVCSPEGDWVNIPCGAGETCAAGKCDSVAPCTAGEKKCATASATKVCDTDGSAWVVSACGDGKICKAGDCVLDVTGAECNPFAAGQCLDAKTLLRCRPAGRGFDVVDCPATAPCSAGQCQGPACAIGQSDCNFDPQTGASSVRNCAGGTTFTEKPCTSGSACQMTLVGGVATAVCASTAQCNFFGQRVCGDPNDPSVDARSAYSECRNGNAGSQMWVRVDCVAPATCDPSNPPGCSVICTPGEKRCAGAAGYQECGPDGTWLPVQSCNTGSATGLGCRSKPGGTAKSDAGALPDIECVDQVCALLSTGGTITGDAGGVVTAGSDVCVGSQVRECGPDGKLQPAKDCTEGACRITSTAIVGGYRPGACSKDCKVGEKRCVTPGLPLFVSCAADGTWASTYQSCGSSCQTAIDPNGQRTALCGNECLPGTLRCDGDKVQKCGDGRTWLPSTACSAGRCSHVSGGAVCLADCIPGSLVCAGSEKDASDGVSRGTSGSAVCTSQGLLPTTTTACAGTETCRTSRDGAPTGCVECLGPAVHGGNDAGLVDSRCSTANASVQVCGTNNTWGTATSCGSGSSCFVGVTKACGQCPNFGITGVCSLSNLQSRFGNTCENFGFGSPMTCGDTKDCCSAACEPGNGAFAFCAPSNFSLCLGSSDVTSLGSTVPQQVTGTTLFGDDTLSPTCGRSGTPDTAFSFTAPRSGNFAFDTFGSSIDTVVYAVDALGCDEVACNDDIAFGTLTSRMFVSLVGGQRIIVLVEGLGDFTLSVVDTGQGSCGNGFVDGGEGCDGTNLAGQTCASQTFGSRPGGTLSCAANCTFDTSACTSTGGGGGTGTGGNPNGTGAKGGVGPPPPGPIFDGG